MALDPTARETNFRDSVRKYLIDNLKTSLGYALYFRQDFTDQDIRNDAAIDKWIMVSFGSIYLGVMSEALVYIRPATRNDESGFKLAQVRDAIVGILTGTSTDGTTRIPFYKSILGKPWELIGGIMVHDFTETPEILADDFTKFKTITVNMRFASVM